MRASQRTRAARRVAYQCRGWPRHSSAKCETHRSGHAGASAVHGVSIANNISRSFLLAVVYACYAVETAAPRRPECRRFPPPGAASSRTNTAASWLVQAAAESWCRSCHCEGMSVFVVGRVAVGLLLISSLACDRTTEPQVRDESHPAPSPSPPRSKGCGDVPTAADLKRLLQAAPAQNGDAGGLNHGKAMWGAVVDRNGQLCALAVSTEDLAATWPGSRGIAIAKASTANAFSSDTAPLSTARLYTLSQPGHSLWGAANGNPLNPLCAGGGERRDDRHRQGLRRHHHVRRRAGALQGTDARRRTGRQRRYVVRRSRDRQARAAGGGPGADRPAIRRDRLHRGRRSVPVRPPAVRRTRSATASRSAMKRRRRLTDPLRR